MFVVTDPGIAAINLHFELIQILQNSGITVEVFDQIEADPKQALITRCATSAVDFDADLVIGFGGGSSLDAAKLTAVLAKQQQSIESMYGIEQVKSSRLPLILVPTTAGTGSEATPVAIVTTGETTKSGVVSNVLLPDAAILDAHLTVGLPSKITAATGIDAMVHAIEAFTTKHKKNPLSDSAALEALRLMSKSIKDATHNGTCLIARSNMLLGAFLAGQAFANAPVAAVHALAYPLGGRHHVAHGLSNSLVLPHVLRFNKDSCQGLYAQLARHIHDCPRSGNDGEQVDLFIQYIEELIDNLGLPTSMSEMGITIDPEQLGHDAMLQQRLLVNNRREVSLSDAIRIYEIIR